MGILNLKNHTIMVSLFNLIAFIFIVGTLITLKYLNIEINPISFVNVPEMYAFLFLVMGVIKIEKSENRNSEYKVLSKNDKDLMRALYI